MKQKEVLKSLRRSYRQLREDAQQLKPAILINSVVCQQLQFAVLYETSFVNVDGNQITKESFLQFRDKIEFYIAQAYIRGFVLSPSSVCVVNEFFSTDLSREGTLKDWNDFLEQQSLQQYRSFDHDVLNRNFDELGSFSNPNDLLDSSFNANQRFLASPTVLWHFCDCFPQTLAKVIAWALNTLTPLALEFLIPKLENEYFESEEGTLVLAQAKTMYVYHNFERDLKLICGFAHGAVDQQQLEDLVLRFPQLQVVRETNLHLKQKILQLLTITENVECDVQKQGARLRAEDLIIGGTLETADLIKLII